MNKGWNILLGLFLLVAGASDGAAQELARTTLQGLASTYIIVDAFSPGGDKFSLNTGELAEQMATKLDSVGIQVLEKSDWEKTEDKPVLYINVSTIKTGLGYYVYSMNVQFFQMVSLIRDPAVKKLAMTWRTQGYLGSIQGKKLSEKIRDGMTEIMDEFIADYLSANPEKIRPEPLAASEPPPPTD